MNKTLLQHRQELAANPVAYTKDLSRAAQTLTPHLKKAGYGLLKASQGGPERDHFVRLIFRAQCERPFFHVEAPLPYCWNAPSKGGWDVNYIKYEWGHLRSINQNPDSAFHVENLCLMSARCNQHIQSSMNIDELLVYGGALEAVIQKNFAARRALFVSDEWKTLLSRLERFRGAV